MPFDKLPKKKVIIIVGPTATGKTALGVALAGKIKGEVISADSMQAYKGMDIVSQAPLAGEEKGIPHHLTGFLSPEEEYSAARFSKKAMRAISGIIKRKKTPIVVGGSGLYVKALTDGIFPSKGKDQALRKKLYDTSRKKGSLVLHARLKKIDPDAAGKIHPNDVKRIIRAIEIYEVEERTKTSLKKKTKGIREKYDVRAFGLNIERSELYAKINKRVDKMFKDGIVDEVKKLSRFKLSATSKQALGVKQVKGYIAGDYGMEETKEMIKRDTRRFAKRQLTWFRADKSIKWMDAKEIPGKIAGKIVKALDE